MTAILTINAIFLVTEATLFLVFAGVVVAGGGVLYVFNANKTSTGRQSLAPNKNLINEKKAELLEYELKPKPSKVLVNERSKKFDESLAKIDLEAMSINNLPKIKEYEEGLQKNKEMQEEMRLESIVERDKRREKSSKTRGKYKIQKRCLEN